MAHPPVLEIDPLLEPIPGDEPAGRGVPLPVREELDRHRKEIDPADFDASDPSRPTEMKRAEWPKIVEITQEILAGSSKDLMIVARLTEALTRVHGFVGLRDSFVLFRRLADECWDRLRPVIEEPDDLEARASAFNWLDDADRGARFPTTVRQVPILHGEKGTITWQDWNHSRTGKGTLTPELFDQAVSATPRADCVAAFEQVDEAIAEFQKLYETLNTRMGAVAPGMVGLRQAVFECHTLAKQILERKGPAPTDDEGGGETPSGTEGPAGDGGGSAVGRSMQSRAQVYARLAEAADVLARLEPHSPIPYLIRRAVVLGDLPFPDLIKELISDATVRYDLGRNLGIKDLHE